MPNLQFSINEAAYDEARFRAKALGVSTNRLGKAVFVRWLKSHHTVSSEEMLELEAALQPPPLPEGY